jgi:glycosyltransferase involved in cell wall biosynthesis
MRIGVEACTWANRRGYGRFTRELVSSMVARHPEHEFVLVVDCHTARECSFPTEVQTLVVETTAQPTKAAAANGSRSLHDVWRMSRAASRAQFDVFLFPTRYSFYPLFSRTPTVVTFHDATSESCPELLFPSRRARLLWWVKSRLALQRADRLVTVSKDARRQIASAFRLAEDSITVVSEGPDMIFRPNVAQDELAVVRARYDLPAEAPIILYVGGISPHKNLQALLRAAAIARREGLASWHVVLVGDYTNDSFLGCYNELNQLVYTLGIQDRVTFTGYVPDEDLVLLYNTAAMLVLPSKGEGFGLPLVEAMACGVPIAASNRNSIPEVLDGAGLLFDPDCDSAIANCILRLLREPELAARLRELGLVRAAAYSWSAGADIMMRVLEEAARR